MSGLMDVLRESQKLVISQHVYCTRVLHIVAYGLSAKWMKPYGALNPDVCLRQQWSLQVRQGESKSTS